MKHIVPVLLMGMFPLLTGAEPVLDENDREMAAWIDAHVEGAISPFEETVSIGSATMNHDGAHEAGRAMHRRINALGLGVHSPNEEPGLTSTSTAIERADSLIYRLGLELQSSSGP